MEYFNSPLVGFLFGSLFAVLVFFLYFYYKGRFKAGSSNNGFGLASNLGVNFDSSLIFDDNFFGLAFFDEKQACVYVNRSFLGLFELAASSDLGDLDQFLTQYGDTNGMRSAFLLGTKQFQVLLEHEKRYIHLQYRRVKHGASLWTSLIAYDVTEKEQRQEQTRQFVANVSHELKTPLTTIKSYSESLLDWGLNEKSKDKIASDVSRIFEDALRMERLVNDLSLLTSIDSRGIKPLMAEFDLVPLVRGLVDRLNFEAVKKDIVLEFKCLAKIPLVFAEKSSVERIVNNLISNAIKYTPKDGYVSVFLNLVHDEIYIKVSDNGMGISPENFEKIFERFFRVDRTGSVIYGGTGLGLAIARDLATLHAGRIEVKSELNKGSDFIFFLPSAGRVYKDTIQAFEDLHPLEDEIYVQAKEELLAKCERFFPYRTSLLGLSEEEKNFLCEVKEISLPPVRSGSTTKVKKAEELRKNTKKSKD